MVEKRRPHKQPVARRLLGPAAAAIAAARAKGVRHNDAYARRRALKRPPARGADSVRRSQDTDQSRELVRGSGSLARRV